MDEARIIAWIDGELPDDEAAEVAAAVASDPDLTAMANGHRRMKARFAAAFAPIADEPVALPQRPSAAIVSLAAVRTERAREARTAAASPRRNWVLPGAIAASLLVGLAGGFRIAPSGVSDSADALALSPTIASALDTKLSGQPGPVGVALSFRDHDGAYCRSFVAQHLGGVACKESGGWLLRYAAPVEAQHGDYRMAGSDPASAQVIAAMIAGDPLDANGERKALTAGWR